MHQLHCGIVNMHIYACAYALPYAGFGPQELKKYSIGVNKVVIAFIVTER